jgi:hypothetical protein
MSSDMNVAALCLQEINRRWRTGDYISPEDYYRAVWQLQDGSPTTPGAVGGVSSSTGQGHGLMPGIVEEGSADEREVDTSSAMSPPPHFHTVDLDDSPPRDHSNL